MTMLSFSESFYGVVNALAKRNAPDSGIIDGANPVAFNTSDPLRIWIIQVVLIVFVSQVLQIFLRRIRQPTVISEILAGIILGPTAMGRIPGFTERIFFPDSLWFLNLTANLGLVLYLFLVGLEIEGGHMRRNSKISLTIALCAMVIPFGIGAGYSNVIYKHFIPKTTKYTLYMLFNGVSFSITAFPVLCRILTELKLLDTSVGVIVLSAGVCNDLVGWTLLALAIALVNATSGLTALWVIMSIFAYALFVIFVVRHALLWFARWTNSLDGNPSILFMTVTMMFVLSSAFFTDVIGVHAIFGGFLAGLAVPRAGGVTIILAEKLEDMVGIILLPLYFTLSGLSTNLGLLNTGKIWGFTISLILLDWAGKFTGGSLGAKIAGLKWREAGTVGTLMSCKGLVELVVLNIGLEAGILTTQVFSMFVLDALFLTFCTTPVVSFLYPPHRRLHVNRAGDVINGIGAAKPQEPIHHGKSEGLAFTHKTRFTALLDKFDHLPGVMSLCQLLASSIQPSTERPSSQSDADSLPSRKEKLIMTQPMSVTALRLIELTDRTSTLMMSSHTDTLVRTDPLLKIFRTVGDLNDTNVSNELHVVPLSSFGRAAGDSARGSGSDLVIVGWASSAVHTEKIHGEASNPFEHILRTASGVTEATATTSASIRSVFKDAATDIALFMDQRGAPTDSYGHKHVFMPFFGGADDRSALQLVVQLCLNPRITATIVRVSRGAPGASRFEVKEESLDEKDSEDVLASGFTISSLPAFPETVYGHQNTAVRLQSTLADDMLWESCTSPAADSLHLPALRRIKFVTVSSPDLLQTAIDYANQSIQSADAQHGRLLTVIGRSKNLGPQDTIKAELTARLEKINSSGSSAELRRTIGDPATALLTARIKSDLLVIQATKQQIGEEA